MRKFFSFAVGNRGDEQTESSKERSGKYSAASSYKSGKDKDGDNQSISPLVLSAATVLSIAIEEILCDTPSLSGDQISGFQRLMNILQETEPCVDLVSIAQSGGVGCVQILLNHSHNPSFIETCNQTTLAIALTHALRILRMYEIKLSKTESHPSSERGLTFISSERVCALFRVLCSDPATVEKFRPSLIKFITYPLIPLPKCGVHLQLHAASVLTQLCRSGFQSQQVWYLHDQQLIQHVVRSMVDLTGISQSGSSSPSKHPVPSASASSSSSNDTLLRGDEAEQAGMWLTAIKCLVDVICASMASGSVLVSDFELAGGHKLLTAILEKTSSERLIVSMNIVIKLMFDSQKGIDDPIAFPNAAGILYDLLLRAMGLERGLVLDDSIDKMVSLGHQLYEAREKVVTNQHVIQNISYVLLTLYSNDTRNCIILEESYHFLPTLIISIPALRASDAISAALTALNYVCQCVDSASTLPILSLCAAATVIVFTTLHGYNDATQEMEREVALTRLEAVYTSIESMIRTNAKFSVALVRCGMLEHLVCGPIEQLRASIWQGASPHPSSLAVYANLVEIIVLINRRNQFVADEIRRCGLQVMFRDLIKADAITADFTKRLLVLLEDLAKRDTSHLEETLQTFIDLLRHTRSNFLKVACILQSLTAVLLSVPEAPTVWRNIKGFSALLEVLSSMDGLFFNATEVSEGTDSLLQDEFSSLKCAIRCIAADAATNTGMQRNVHDMDYKLQEFRLNCYNFSKALRNTGVFSARSRFSLQCLDCVFWLINGGSTHPIIVNPHSCIIIVEILPFLSEELILAALNLLRKHANSRVDGAQLLCQAGLVRMLLETFTDITSGKSETIKTQIFELVKHLMSNFLIIDDFVCLISYFTRKETLGVNSKVLLPFQCASVATGSAPVSWTSVSIIDHLACNCEDILCGVPFISLGVKASNIPEQPAYLSVFLNEFPNFPANGFTFSAWVQLCDRSDCLKEGAAIDAPVIPILSLSSFSVGGCFLEVHFDVMHCLVRIIARKGRKNATIRFNSPFSINSFSWNLITISLRRSKRFGSSKSTFGVYFNGIAGVAVNADSLEFDSPAPTAGAPPAPVVLAVGRNTIEEATLTSDSAVGDKELLETMQLPDLWRLGPCTLFEDALSNGHVSSLFTKGPTYTGTFNAESSTGALLSAVSCGVLRECSATNLSTEHYIDLIGLKGMEYVIEPRLESAASLPELPALPTPLLCFNSRNIVSAPLPSSRPMNTPVSGEQSKEDIDKINGAETCESWRYCRVSLLNVASKDSSPEGALVNGQYCCAADSVASCVSALGGPTVLFPILQGAVTGPQISSFFRILKACNEMSTSNLAFMQSAGYKMCSYVLSLKPKMDITVDIIDAIFNLVVYRRKSSGASESLLFVDTSAFFFLLLNTQVWDFSNSQAALRILQLINSLVQDECSGELNRKRLSSLGIVKWIIFLTIFGTDQSAASKSIGSVEPSKTWPIQSPTCREMSDAQDFPDEFLELVITSLDYLVSADMRKRDLECIANSILHSLIPQYDQPQGVSSPVDGSQVDNAVEQCVSFDDSPLSPMCTTRIYLLRFVTTLFERCIQVTKGFKVKSSDKRPPISSSEGQILNVFRSSFSPEWFLTMLSKIYDRPTWTYYLRLIGIMMEYDSNFQYEFCNQDGIALIFKQLQMTPIDLCAVIPLIGMLFRIPMSTLPYKIHDTLDVLVALEGDGSQGPCMLEPMLTMFTLPLLELLFESVCRAAREKKDDEISMVSSTIIAVFKRSYQINEDFRSLLQHNSAIGYLSTALLSCSNAITDYGTKIFVATSGSLDLTALVIEDYLDVMPSQVEATAVSDAVTPETESLSVEQQKMKELTFYGDEGRYLLSLTENVLSTAIKDAEQGSVLSIFMLSFPPNLLPAFVSSFHFLLAKLMSNIIQDLITSKCDFSNLQVISNVLTFLVPLARVHAFNDVVALEILKLSLFVLKHLTDVSASRPAPSEKLNVLLRDVGCSARYFAIMAVLAVGVERKNAEQLRLSLLKMVRMNMHLFIQDSVSDDIFDFSGGIFRHRRESAEVASDRGSGAAVLEAFQISWGSDSSASKRSIGDNSNSQFVLALGDKQKLSQLFCVAIICNCCPLVFDENNTIREEAIRLFALIAIHRSAAVDQVIYSAATSSKSSMMKISFDSSVEDLHLKQSRAATSLFIEGISKLVPEDSTLYEAFLRGDCENGDREEHRIADFSYWFADNSTLCNRVLAPIESYLQTLSPALSDTEDIIKQIHAAKARVDRKAENATTVLASMRRAEEGQRLGELVTSLVRKWRAHGLMYLAAGALSWWKVWNILQSCPLWGSKPTRQIMVDRDEGGSIEVDTPRLCLADEEQNDHVLWKLNFMEGPERCRRRMERDFSAHLAALSGIAEVPKVKSGATSETSAQLELCAAAASVDSSADATVTAEAVNEIAAPSLDVPLPPASTSTPPTERLTKTMSSMESFLENISRQGLLQQSGRKTDPSFQTIDDEFEPEFEQDRNSCVDGDEAERLEQEASTSVADAADLSFTSTEEEAHAIVEEMSELAVNALLVDVEEASAGATAGQLFPMSPVLVTRTGSFSGEGEEFDMNTGDSPAVPLQDSVRSINAEASSPGRSPGSRPRPTRIILHEGEIFASEREKKSASQRRQTLQANKRSLCSIEIVKGLIGASELSNGKVFNVSRILGLEAQRALLVLTTNNVHLLMGFRTRSSSSRSSTSGVPLPSDKNIEFVPSNSSTRKQPTGLQAVADFVTKQFAEDGIWLSSVWEELLSVDFGYSRIALSEIYTIFRRRHQLKSCAVELTDVKGMSLLFAFDSMQECDDMLLSLFESELPSSLFSRVIGMKPLGLLRGLHSTYSRLMSQFLTSTTKMWQLGEISNFEYLIHLNAAAGRSFYDLTQYPVFPWVLSDYSSEVLDLSDSKVFRDLSKPMGALGSRRAKQYRERFKTMDEFKRSGVEGTPPPFHYGTHYSCAGYVLNYLIRLQPYSNMAIALQGGQIDKADRLFSSIEQCWKSASHDNLQDVRELIPEFFYLPEFLKNSNHFGFGTTQKGEKVDDVSLPRWANGDANEFIRIHREALESKYVSEHLNDWIDLIFGCKQRGTPAEDAMNVFIHLTYDDAVDVDDITDPVLRSATISQINNFGQSPTRLFSKPHPRKRVPDILKKINDSLVADPHALAWHEHISPSLCITGATDVSFLTKVSFAPAPTTLSEGKSAIGDVRMVSRDKSVTVPPHCYLLPPSFKRAVKVGGACGSINILALVPQAGRLFDQEKDSLIFENLHEKRVTCAAFSERGDCMVTGSEDSSVRLWSLEKLNSAGRIEREFTFSGHTGAVLCVDICVEYHIIASGSMDYSACVWDSLTGKLLRVLENHLSPVISISINSLSGSIATLTSSQLRHYTLNGDLLASVVYSDGGLGNSLIGAGTFVLCPSSADWQNGIAAVTGHATGQVCLWRTKRELQCPSSPTTLTGSEDSVSSLEQGKEGASTKDGSLGQVSPPCSPRDGGGSNTLVTRLIPSLLSKTHRASISVIRLCSHTSLITSSLRVKELVDKSHENAGAKELFVGDEDGFVSRWATAKLDQLSASDIQSLINQSPRLKQDSTASKTAARDKDTSSRISNITRSATLLLSRNKLEAPQPRDSPSQYSDDSFVSEPTTPF